MVVYTKKFSLLCAKNIWLYRPQSSYCLDKLRKKLTNHNLQKNYKSGYNFRFS